MNAGESDHATVRGLVVCVGRLAVALGATVYFSWLGFETREILILRRTEPDEFP